MAVAAREGISFFSCAPASMCGGLTRAKRRSPPCSTSQPNWCRVRPRRFRVERVESMSHDTDSMDVVISSAVLHFARDASHWLAMVHEMWRVLAPGGLLFARLATTVGQPRLRPLGDSRYVMPDGTTRFLVDHERLLTVTRELGGSLLDPLKSTVVHEQRSMGTWVVRKKTQLGRGA